MLIVVGWVMWGTPVGVFPIMLTLTLGTGLAVVGLVALFFVMVCGAQLLAIEAYLMVEAVKHNPIYDACATVLNVTGDMAAATLLSRGSR